MKKVIKLIKNNTLLGIIIGGIIFGSIGVGAAAYLYSSNQISYSNSNSSMTNVKEALDDLYNLTNIGNATENDIAVGKTALVKGNLITGTQVDATVGVYNLGTSTSFNVKNYIENNNITGVDYTKLTASNFFVGGISSSKNSAGNQHVDNYNTVAVAAINGMAKSYNASTGVLSCYVSATGGIGMNSSSSFHYSAGTTASVNAYLVIY